MKLYSSRTSPFVRKVRIVVMEKGLSEDVDEDFIIFSVTKPNPELAAVNPLMKIPCLILNDGQAVFDSRVICNFLDRESSAGEVLHPTGNVRHKTLIALADGAMDAAVLMVYENLLRDEAIRSSEIFEAQWSKVSGALQYAEREYEDILGHFNMGAIGMLCLLEYLDFRFPDRDWRKDNPKLAKWHENIKDRPSFQATRPEA